MWPLDHVTIICEPEVLAVTIVTTIMKIIDLFSCVRFTFVTIGFEQMKTCTCMQLYFLYLRSERDGGILYYHCVSLSVINHFCLSVRNNKFCECRVFLGNNALQIFAMRWCLIWYDRSIFDTVISLGSKTIPIICNLRLFSSSQRMNYWNEIWYTG